ncbi:MAG: hypothetical protein ACOYXS_06495 [Chloroflexota bacterium]
MTTRQRGVAAPAPGLELVAPRTLVLGTPVAWLALTPGDRPLVAAGESVLAGAPLAERVRRGRVAAVPAGAVGPSATPGDWWLDSGRRRGVRRSRSAVDEGELLFRAADTWQVVGGERDGLLEAPAAGIVRAVRPGSGISLATAAAALIGTIVTGGPARGRLEVLADAEGELSRGALDVGLAGAIVVAGSRVDAETLTRARAMGIRGVVVAAVSSRDLREFAASEARQRASFHPPAPFAVLVLEGHLRQPIASPASALLLALAGREVAIIGDPPALLFDPPAVPPPPPPIDLVRVRYGPAAGREGRWLGLAGRRRFAAGVHLEAGLVEAGEARPLVVPLADLERFA